MTPEQLDELKTMLTATKQAILDVEQMIDDLNKCGSEVSKKYLAVAIKKHASLISSNMKPID